MKSKLESKRYRNGERFCHLFVSVMVLFLVSESSFIKQARAQDLIAEPNITLEVKDRSLGEVLDIISHDTGYRFNVSSQWRDYSVNASIQNMPLNKGLNRILTGLNHVIIYESEKNIKILVYGKANFEDNKSYPERSRSSLIKKFQYAMEDDVSDNDDWDEDEEGEPEWD